MEQDTQTAPSNTLPYSEPEPKNQETPLYFLRKHYLETGLTVEGPFSSRQLAEDAGKVCPNSEILDRVVPLDSEFFKVALVRTSLQTGKLKERVRRRGRYSSVTQNGLRYGRDARCMRDGCMQFVDSLKMSYIECRRDDEPGVAVYAMLLNDSLDNCLLEFEFSSGMFSQPFAHLTVFGRGETPERLVTEKWFPHLLKELKDHELLWENNVQHGLAYGSLHKMPILNLEDYAMSLKNVIF